MVALLVGKFIYRTKKFLVKFENIFFKVKNKRNKYFIQLHCDFICELSVTHTHTHTHINKHIYTYIHIHTHKHTHTYTHKYT
jgi:hypothetical protein